MNPAALSSSAPEKPKRLRVIASGNGPIGWPRNEVESAQRDRRGAELVSESAVNCAA
jgi:hypothetical protein